MKMNYLNTLAGTTIYNNQMFKMILMMVIFNVEHGWCEVFIRQEEIMIKMFYQYAMMKTLYINQHDVKSSYVKKKY